MTATDPATTWVVFLRGTGLSENTLDLRRLDVATGGTTIRTHGTVQRLAAKFL